MMKIYFYDAEKRYVGSRELFQDEEVPQNCTTKAVDIKDGQQAYFTNNKWVVSNIPEEVTENVG